MALSLDAARQIEQDLLLKADVLAHYLNGLGVTDLGRAKEVCAEIVSRLEDAVSTYGHPSSPDRSSPVLVSSRSGGEETEEFILESLASSPRGLSVQDIVDLLIEAEIEIKRATLVVRLHRMLRAGKLMSRTHGHYVLSEAEHDRRKSA
jgi:hypothetical protein